MLVFLIDLINEKKINKFWFEYFFLKERLKNLYLNYLLYKFVSKNKFCNNIIFPYEEKTYERSLISAISNEELNSQIKLYGLCVNPQHNLASFLKKFEGLNIPRSDNYLFCGALYRKYFCHLFTIISV